MNTTVETQDDVLRQLRRFHWSGPSPAGPTDEARPSSAVCPPFELGDSRRGALAADPATPLRLLDRAVRARVEPARAAMSQEIGELVAGLRALIELDRRRYRDADGLAAEIGELGARFLDPGSLAATLGPEPGGALDPARRERIDAALEGLAAWDGFAREMPLVVIHDGSRALSAPREAGLRPDGGGEERWLTVASEDPCAAACQVFDRHAERFAAILRAVRVARLEIASDYDPARHDPWLQELDWQAFSHRELMLLPRVAAWLDAADLAGRGLLSASRALLSGRPIELLVTLDPSSYPGVEAGEDPLTGYRFEPGYLGLSLREAVVQQTTVAHPQHMLRGFTRAIAAPRAGLHVIAVAGADGGPALDSDAEAEGHAGPSRLGHRLAAAVAARAHPLFFYDPGAGRSWARRLDFAGNPQPEDDWPRYELVTSNGDSSGASFTFADYAACDGAFAGHFETVDGELGADELVSVDAWLGLTDGEAAGKLPCVAWTDGDGRPRRAVVSRRLALACRDRLDFWRTLQELAGVRSEYLDRAAAATRREAAAEHAAELERLREEHRHDLERVRAEAAREVVERLMALLLESPPSVAPFSTGGSGATTLPSDSPPPVLAVAPPVLGGAEVELAPSAPPPSIAPPPAAAPPAVAPEPPPAEVGEEAVEPYIDTELCTTCNDCININPRLFAYNADKKAVITDPTAGTFKDLVLAAEKCAAGIIHPGSPLDPDEADLEQWIARAARFN